MNDERSLIQDWALKGKGSRQAARGRLYKNKSPDNPLRLFLLYPAAPPPLLTKADSQPLQAIRSFASACQLKPFDFANDARASSHLVAGRPGHRSPPCGNQFTISLVHLPSVRRMVCPAHCHLRRRCSPTRSFTLPSSIAVSMHLAVRCCHSIQFSPPALSRFCVFKK